MFKKLIYKNKFILLIIIFVSFSCSEKKFEKIPLGKVNRDTYLDQITVTGVLVSSNTFNISCPDIRHTDATVLYLIPDGTYVKAGDTVCILEAREIENRYNDALKNLETSRSEYNKSKADLELQYLMLKAQVEVIETSTSIAKLDSIQLKFSSPVRRQIIELQLKKAEIEKQKILKQLEFLEKINASELQKMRLKILQQENKLKIAKSTLDKLTITSKIDGLAIRAMIRWRREKVKEGDVVWRRFPLVEIPDLSQMQVKLNVNESNYKRIDKNQKVDIYIDAIPGLKMTGKIKYKEPMGRPIKEDSKVKEFGVVASIDSLIGTPKPGISATCNIKIHEVKDTLIIPYVSVFDNDSQRVVYVAKDNHFEQRKIELLINNNNIGIVKSGVFENELVSLIRPPESLIKNIN